jgi:hypothetical protein
MVSLLTLSPATASSDMVKVASLSRFENDDAIYPIHLGWRILSVPQTIELVTAHGLYGKGEEKWLYFSSATLHHKMIELNHLNRALAPPPAA